MMLARCMSRSNGLRLVAQQAFAQGKRSFVVPSTAWLMPVEMTEVSVDSVCSL